MEMSKNVPYLTLPHLHHLMTWLNNTFPLCFIYSFKLYNNNKHKSSQFKWSANRDLELQASLHQMPTLTSLSFMCHASVQAYLNFEKTITGILVAPGRLWQSSWNVDRGDSSQKCNEVLAVDEASREVTLLRNDENGGEWELRCKKPK